MASVLGVEIGNDSVKIAVCNSGKVKQLICEKLPDNMVSEGKVLIADAMSEFLREICKNYKLPTTKVNFVLPPQAVLTRTITMPLLSEEELTLNLPYEFKAYIGNNNGNKVDYVYDYVVLDSKEAEGDKPGQLELFAAAIDRAVVEEYRSIFKKAGLKLVCGMPREMAFQNLVRAGKNVPKELAIIDVGHTRTSVDIYCDGVYSMGKFVDVGGRSLDSTISKDSNVDERDARVQKESNFENCQSSDGCLDIYNYMATEMIKVVNFYGYSTNSEALRDVYFCGGASLIEKLRLTIVKGTSLIPHGIGKLFETEDGFGDSTFCALAVGAGIQPAKEEKPLKPAEKKSEKEDKNNGK